MFMGSMFTCWMLRDLIESRSTSRPCLRTVRIWTYPFETHVHQSKRRCLGFGNTPKVIRATSCKLRIIWKLSAESNVPSNCSNLRNRTISVGVIFLLLLFLFFFVNIYKVYSMKGVIWFVSVI